MACPTRSCARRWARAGATSTRAPAPASGPLDHAVEAPFPRDALERVLPALGEVDARADHEVLDGVGPQHLPRLAQRAHPRADVHGHPRHVVAADLALARVQ